MRFDLKFLLLLMSNACVFAWAIAANDPFAFLAFAAIVSLTAAFYAVSKGSSPFTWACLGGAIAAVLLTIWVGPLQAIVYLLFRVPDDDYQDFFEDGMAFNFITAPILCLVFYVPIGVLTGLFCGTVVRTVQLIFNRKPTGSRT